MKDRDFKKKNVETFSLKRNFWVKGKEKSIISLGKGNLGERGRRRRRSRRFSAEKRIINFLFGSILLEKYLGWVWESGGRKVAAVRGGIKMGGRGREEGGGWKQMEEMRKSNIPFERRFESGIG